MSSEILAALFEELHHPDTRDRSARIQNLCEVYWDILSNDTSIAQLHLNEFTLLLREDENLALAQLVIPELRYSAPTAKEETKRHIQHLFQSVSSLSPNTTQTKYAEVHQLFESEKDIIQEMDLYRAALLLFNRGEISEARKTRLREWLQNAPK
ncbi:uncharacterized protein J4E92_009059 [Alternaria infectoria]|uniref:uncharacterized protein n=1 Tax=Alternaria ventricosa TaxID=1187951 RepID=UPI0020C41C8C|nr:uncharacterized protein J4E93_002786 [Alternaria ventricosa]XP_049212713.1 uncharacterized protein J4E79_003440 [Alternaria viburni]XP_051349496.1 uncharacterized protein J4E92_009059 [Alternaria infectoria]KAI4650430.1 hypothetical protein J4E93_002786 [Alternaria ventricosa]KAI4663940.1 hypothetical protein J4E79_003440 [Alternaria viburni]KAI4917665.1 hypothetical protein J4E92_009059 [Alternaria infectoria]